MDLSVPHCSSVNNAISVDCCHMCYASVLYAATIVRQLGRGTLLVQVNLLRVYRILPVMPMITFFRHSVDNSGTDTMATCCDDVQAAIAVENVCVTPERIELSDEVMEEDGKGEEGEGKEEVEEESKRGVIVR